MKLPPWWRYRIFWSPQEFCHIALQSICLCLWVIQPIHLFSVTKLVHLFYDGLHPMDMMLTFIYVVWCNNGHPCLSPRVIWRFYSGSPMCGRPIWLIAGCQNHDMVLLTRRHTLLGAHHFLRAYINVCIILWSSASICVTINK